MNEWVTKDGKRFEYKKMSHIHLINAHKLLCKRFIEQRKTEIKKRILESIESLEKEADRRGLSIRKQVNLLQFLDKLEN